jgi:hypothetical protein
MRNWSFHFWNYGVRTFSCLLCSCFDRGMHPDFVEDIDNYTWLGLQGTMDLNGELETKLKANQADFDAFNDNYDPTMDIAEAAADQDIADLTSYFTGLKVYDPATEDEDAIPKYVSVIYFHSKP